MRKLLLGLLCGSMLFAAELTTRKALTLQAAKEMAAAAEVEARKNNWNVVIAIVDDGGYLIYLQRMDDTQLVSVEIAQLKARAAALYRRPTKELEESLASGRGVLLRLPDALPAEGGLPIRVDGRVIGAIGVSGVVSAQDAQVGRAGLAVLEKK